MNRPAVLGSATYKLTIPSYEEKVYLTITDNNGSPYEIFVNSKHMDNWDHITFMCRSVSKRLQHGESPHVIAEQMIETYDPKGGYFANGEEVLGVISHFGHVLKQHMEKK